MSQNIPIKIVPIELLDFNVIETVLNRALFRQRYNAMWPVTSLSLMRKIDLVELSKLFFEFNSIKYQGRSREDVYRVLTIASAVYKFPIPNEMMIIDFTTKVIFYALFYKSRSNLPVRVSKNSLEESGIKITKIPASRNIEFYTHILPYIGTYLFRYRGTVFYPSLESIYKEISSTRTKTVVSELSIEELSTLITVYATFTGLSIPLSYVNYNQLTIDLINKDSKKKLTLIKGKENAS